MTAFSVIRGPFIVIPFIVIPFIVIPSIVIPSIVIPAKAGIQWHSEL